MTQGDQLLQNKFQTFLKYVLNITINDSTQYLFINESLFKSYLFKSFLIQVYIYAKM